jgi:hypothetical protein
MVEWGQMGLHRFITAFALVVFGGFSWCGSRLLSKVRDHRWLPVARLVPVKHIDQQEA